MLKMLMALLGVACMIATLYAKIAFGRRARARHDDTASATASETPGRPAAAPREAPAQADLEGGVHARRARLRVVKNSSA